MNRKPVIITLVVTGIVATFLNPLIGGVIAAGVWVYLVRMTRKRKIGALDDELEPELSAWQLKRLRAFLTVAGCAFPVFVAGAVVHNVSHGLSGTEGRVFFFIALGALLVFIAATAAGLAIFLKARRIID